MRQNLGEKKVAKLRQQTGLPVIAVQVRGNTGHRKDLFLDDGRIVYLYLDGTMQVSEFRHGRQRGLPHETS